jgi:hypothetical protein
MDGLRPPLPRTHDALADMARRCWENMDTKSAQFLAIMAVYEALLMPGYGMSIGEQVEQLRDNQQGPWNG